MTWPWVGELRASAEPCTNASVRVEGADVGDTTAVVDTVVDATTQLARAGAPHRLEELIADKGYHSNRTLIDLHALEVRAYIAEPDRGRRRWRELPEAQALVYANRRRLRGARGGRLRRHRAEYVERSFAHLYETGAMRRTHLRGHQNILKRLPVHAGAFTLGLIMRQLTGYGTPRRLQGRATACCGMLTALTLLCEHLYAHVSSREPTERAMRQPTTDTFALAMII
jgi:transposase